MEAEGLSLDWYVHRHRTEHEILPWEHLTAGLHKDFLWGDWQAALAGAGVEDCRWTPCYDCGVCTGYAIEHVVASPVAAGRRQPGHRPGPRRAAARRPVMLLGSAVDEAEAALHKLGKIRFTSHRDMARVWERALRRAGCRWRRRRVHAPAPAQLRPRAADRRRSIAEYVDVDLARRSTADDESRPARRAQRVLPDGFDVLVAAERPRRSRVAAGSRHVVHVGAVGSVLDVRHHRDAGRLLDAASLPLDRERKGKRSADDVRPLILTCVADDTHV